MEYYLLQKRYDLVSDIFESGAMDFEDYLKLASYFESRKTKQIFTINLN